MTPFVKEPGAKALSWIPLAGLLVAAPAVALLAPASTAQRSVGLSVIGGSLAWLLILLLLLGLTPEGLGRLSSSPPLAFDLLAAVPFVAGMFAVDAIGSSGSRAGPSLVGAAAGAVLMVSFSLTVRWLWWEHQRRRAARRTDGR